RCETMLILRWDCAIQTRSNSIVTGSRSGGKKKTHRQRLDYDPERVKIDFAVAVKPVFKYQGLRSLPWGVRRSLLRRIPVSGAPTSLGRPLRHFLRADLGQAHPPQPLLTDATVRPGEVKGDSHQN